MPNLLEMLSYTFFFPAITSGPLFFFNDYKHFIEEARTTREKVVYSASHAKDL